MKYLILLLLAFNVTADTAIELDGNLALIGDPSGSTVDTNISYTQEGGNVQICIGLTLEPGTGQGGSFGTFDPLTSNNPVTLTESGQEVSPDLTGQWTYITSSDLGYDTSSDVMVYYEIEILANGSNSLLGLGWDDEWTQGIQNNYAIMRQNGTQFLVTGESAYNPSFPAFSVGYVQRVWLKGTSMWIGYKSGATSAEDGDPANELSPATTALPVDTIVYPGVWMYFSNTQVRLRTLSEDFLSSPLGATALGEQ